MSIYQKYIPEDQEIQLVVHGHWLTVMDHFILWLSFWAFIPAFLYYESERIQNLVPFYFLEWLLFIVFIKIVYELFNWYHDVWVVTDHAVYDIEWSLLKTNVESIHHENIEGIEVDKHRIWDNIFNKWDIIIHKFWEEELAIYNAYSPYKSAEAIEQFIHPAQEEEMDRFDMIMDTLSGVVTDYLERHWLKEQHDNPDYIHGSETNIDDDYSIDVRH